MHVFFFLDAMDLYAYTKPRGIVMKKHEIDEMFNEIYRSTYPAVSRFVFFKMDKIDESKDILQNVYVDLYHDTLLKGKKIDEPEAYLIKIAQNKIANFYKKAKRIVVQDTDEDWVQNIPEDSDSALEAIQHATSDEIWEIIDQMEELDKKILIARCRYEMTFPEIAETMAIKEEKIKARYYRSIKKIQKSLDI